MFNQRASHFRISALAALSLAGTIFLSGCGQYGSSVTSSTATTVATGASKPGTGIGGMVHGGQQPVTGAKVILWAAGTSGTYGTAATNLGSTSTDSSGSFNLNLSPTATITAYTVDANGNATFTANNSFVAGNVVTLTGFTTSTFFNNTTVTVTAASTTLFQATVPAADDSTSATETGTGTAIAQGASACTPGQYLYLTATGGNAGGGINNSLAMMAAVPTPCVTGTGTGSSASTSVFIDEVTTVATATALQQFMSINTSATAPYTGTGTIPWTIGAPATNTKGLANAFLQTANMVTLSTGQTAANFFPSNTVGGLLYTTDVAPDYKKINMLADILAVCINDTTGNLCTGSSGILTYTAITSGATPTSATPVDTIQAAYNMATLPNPALYSGARYWTKSTSTSNYLALLYSDINAQAPFQPYTAAQPADTTIAIDWKTTNPTPTTVGTIYAASVAIDGNGNIWTAPGNSSITANIVTQFNQAGQLLQTVSTAAFPTPAYTLSFYPDSATANTTGTAPTSTQTLTYSRGNSLAIDTNNNAWYADTNAAATGTISTAVTGTVAEITQAGVATAYLGPSIPSVMLVDDANNLFMEGQPVASRYYFSALPVPTSGTAYTSLYEGLGRSTAAYNGAAIDSGGNAWAFNSSATCTSFLIPRGTALNLQTGATTNDVTLPANCAYAGAGDPNGNMWTTDGTSLYYVNIATSLSAPTVTTSFTGGAATGLYEPTGIALDGAGNLWVSSKANAVAEFSTTSSGTTGAVALLSPAGTSIYGYESGLITGTPGNVALDSSGNVWLMNTAGSYVYYLVGAATPVATPLATMYNGKFAVRP